MTAEKKENEIQLVNLQEKHNFERVGSYDGFIGNHAKEAASSIVQVYSKVQGTYIGHSFECNLLLFRQEMARWNYKKIEQINNEVARFPKEHGLVVLGYIDDNNKVVAYDNRVYLEIYQMLTDSQKLDYEDFQKALQALKGAQNVVSQTANVVES